jgi:hypothetical protein
MSEAKRPSQGSDAVTSNAGNEPKSGVSMRERAIGVPTEDDLMGKLYLYLT